MDQIPHTNSTIWSQLFEYRIIRIIHCNSVMSIVFLSMTLTPFPLHYLTPVNKLVNRMVSCQRKDLKKIQLILNFSHQFWLHLPDDTGTIAKCPPCHLDSDGMKGGNPDSTMNKIPICTLNSLTVKAITRPYSKDVNFNIFIDKQCE